MKTLLFILLISIGVMATPSAKADITVYKVTCQGASYEGFTHYTVDRSMAEFMLLDCKSNGGIGRMSSYNFPEFIDI